MNVPKLGGGVQAMASVDTSGTPMAAYNAKNINENKYHNLNSQCWLAMNGDVWMIMRKGKQNGGQHHDYQ